MNAPTLVSEASVSSAPPPAWYVAPVLHIPNAVLQTYWQTLYMHDTLKYRLCEVEDPTWSDVKEMIQQTGPHFQMCALVSQEGEVQAEFALDNFTGQSARIHFSMHPKLTFKEKLLVGQTTLQYLFHELRHPNTKDPFLRSVYGLTPMSNRVACIFALKAGFKKTGVLPGGIKYLGKTDDAMISVATRETLT